MRVRASIAVPVKTSIFSQSMPMRKCASPLFGAVHRYQTVFSTFGSPFSVVAFTFVPVTVPFALVNRIAEAKASFGGLSGGGGGVGDGIGVGVGLPPITKGCG